MKFLLVRKGDEGSPGLTELPPDYPDLGVTLDSLNLSVEVG